MATSQLHDLQLARTNGEQAVLTLVVNAVPGPQVMVTRADIERLVRKLLEAGLAMSEAGPEKVDLNFLPALPPAVPCSQIGIGRMDAGEPALALLFGCITVSASLTPISIAQLAEVVPAMATARLHPAPPTRN